jgi:hypothetical protein
MVGVLLCRSVAGGEADLDRGQLGEGVGELEIRDNLVDDIVGGEDEIEQLLAERVGDRRAEMLAKLVGEAKRPEARELGSGASQHKASASGGCCASFMVLLNVDVRC